MSDGGWGDFPFADETGPSVEDERARAAREYLTAVAEGQPKMDPNVLAAQIGAEMAEGERLRRLGPETGPTLEQIENNPSNYHPPAAESTAPEQVAGPPRSLAADEAAHRAATQAAREAMIREEITVDNPGVAENLAAPAVPAKPAKPESDLQLWICVGADGIRSMTKGVIHPVFGSNAHLLQNMVTCPTCGKPTVRKVTADEDLTGEDERAKWVNLSEAERNVLMRAGAQRQRA